MVLAAQTIDKLLDRHELKGLMGHIEAGCVSIYTPVHRSGTEIREDPIRFKNQLHQALGQLVNIGLRPAEARERLADLSSLLDDAEFWRHNSLGLAAFAAPGRKAVFRVPICMPQLVVVSSRFHIKPLMPLLEPTGPIYILALSQDEVRLLEASASDVRQLRLPNGTPRRLSDLTQYEEAESYMEFHTGTSPQHLGTRRPAVFHGQGVGTDDAFGKKRLLWFCQAIHGAVERTIGPGRAPLVLAAADPLLSIYREVSSYPALSDRHIPGNPERLANAELQARALELLGDVLAQPITRDSLRYRQAAALGQASNNLREVLPAAHDSRVDTLFVSRDAHVPGRYDPVSRRIEVHAEPLAGDQDLLNLAAVRTYLSAGRVHVVSEDRMPEGASVAAIYRFPAPWRFPVGGNRR